MKKNFNVLALHLITAILLSSCRGAEPTPGVTTDATWERIQKNGKIVVGVSMDYPPFEYIDTNFQADGFDIALISEIGREMNLPIDVRNYAFNGLYNALATGQWSMNSSSFSFFDGQNIVGPSNCLVEVQQQSSNYMDTLLRVSSYLIDGSGNLVYYDSNGTEILRFK